MTVDGQAAPVPQRLRGAVYVLAQLHTETTDSYRSELLRTRLFVLLLGSTYRSHFHSLFRQQAGVYEKSGALRPEHIESISRSMRLALGMLAVIQATEERHPRDSRSVLRIAVACASLLEEEELDRIALEDPPPKSPACRYSNWVAGCKELARDIARDMAANTSQVAALLKTYGEYHTGPVLVISPKKTQTFTNIFRTCHAHARAHNLEPSTCHAHARPPCCIHGVRVCNMVPGRGTLYHTQTCCRTSGEKWWASVETPD